MACRYCFYHSLALGRQDYSKGMMSAATAHSIIDSALEFADGTDIFFTFQGGEPLLCPLDSFEDFVGYVRQKNNKGSKISYCLQTNGTLITPEIARFLHDNGFLVGVSLDGDREQSCYRVYPDGSQTFDDVLHGISLLEEYSVSFNVLSVLTKNTALSFRSALKFFKSRGLRYIQFIPALRPLSGEYDSRLYMDCDDFSYFLTKCFNIYYNNNMRGDFLSVRSFDNYALLVKDGCAEQCGMSGCCSTQFAVEGDGSVYPCDFYCTDDWYLGNINETSFKNLYNLPKTAEFLKESFKLDERCRQCEYFYVCRGGGCKRTRQDYDYCPAYKKFFSMCGDKIKELAR